MTIKTAKLELGCSAQIRQRGSSKFQNECSLKMAAQLIISDFFEKTLRRGSVGLRSNILAQFNGL